jgi:hypothetical protein
MKPDRITLDALRMYDAVMKLGTYAEIYPESANAACQWLTEYVDDIAHAITCDPDDQTYKTELAMIKAIRIHMATCYDEFKKDQR